MAKKRVLVTGFEAFGGGCINPSALILDALKDNKMNEMASLTNDVEIYTELLPVVRYDAVTKVNLAIEAVEPDAVLMLGQAAGRAKITFEKVAINLDDYCIPDNAGNQPVEEQVSVNGPTAYFSRLPVKLMAKTLSEAGIPASVSYSAGTYVCNHLFYGVTHQVESLSAFQHIRTGFMHLPLLPEQALGSDKPYMALDTMIEGTLWAIYAALTHQEEKDVFGGVVC
ncbi:pyroglutamyl-peptidase I [Photobacterium sp. J15]|uniref:pyroglutamyl-peptidase I n=1 Tax=Photobacterium sp. J15 TaxID=265901 RepID=UPI0007E2E661|nr:pyroglutamyl-peptidase I [Photobacterium sp. J15]